MGAFDGRIWCVRFTRSNVLLLLHVGALFTLYIVYIYTFFAALIYAIFSIFKIDLVRQLQINEEMFAVPSSQTFLSWQTLVEDM